MCLWRRAALAAISVVILSCAPADPGRHEIGSPVTGVAALVNASAPADDLFASVFCGGVLVAPDEVLTAAHCVTDRAASDVDVVLGADNLCHGRPIDGVRVHVRAISIDQHYEPDTMRFDRASLRLDRVVDGSMVRPLIQDPTTQEAVSLGWGLLAPGASSCRLTATALRLESPEACEHALGPSFDPASMFCARPRTPGGSDTCVGDSGGPLLLGRDPRTAPVVALVSWGMGCGSGRPGAYARVAPR